MKKMTLAAALAFSVTMSGPAALAEQAPTAPQPQMDLEVIRSDMSDHETTSDALIAIFILVMYFVSITSP